MIKTGTSGFSFSDWKGTVYPGDIRQGDILSYYEDELGFDCVEINATYYTLVSARSFEGMERKTRPGFEFVVKAFRGITHDPFDSRLEQKPDLRQAKDDLRKFVYSVGPLREAGKLGAVLLQFPVFFYPSGVAKEYLVMCREEFGDIPLVVEFRNRGWAKPDLFSFLDSNGLSFCAVDEPRLPRLMPFVNRVTGPVGYLRLHGRNKNWFNVPLDERHTYLYSEEELRSFVPEVRRMDEKAEKTYVFFNNSHRGFAVRNAVQFKRLLGVKEQAPVPVSV